MTSETLDIGCGPNPEGTVNLDLFQGWSPHTIGTINGRHIPCFVQGDAQHLPFRDKAFNTVLITHVLEHLPDTDRALREIRRVSHRAIIRVPNNPQTWEHPEHLYTWSRTALEALLKRYWRHVHVTAYTRPSYVGKSRFFKKLNSLPIIGRWLIRVMLNIMRLELEAVCY